MATNHVYEAKKLFMSGRNCSQAVFAAFCDVTGLEKNTSLRIAAPFGGGMGRMREVCGTCSAMLLVAGIIDGYGETDDIAIKKAHYELVQSLLKEFKKRNGSYICREILGTNDTSPTPTPRTAEFYKTRPCLKCVTDAAEILDAYLAKREKEIH